MSDILAANAAIEPELNFKGQIGSYWKLGLGNLLLTIITIGVYRFWGKSRFRRKLWAETIFDGEPLEYRGRGVELLIGALLAFALIIVPIILISIAAAFLNANGHSGVGALLQIGMVLGLFYLIGVGTYRSQRYLLSRTSWRGIRGGMTTGGWGFGWLHLRLFLLSAITLGFASPYVATRLWNTKMNDSMMGSTSLTANAEWRPLFSRFAVLWGVSLVIYIAMFAALFAVLGDKMSAFQPVAERPTPKAMWAIIGPLYLVIIVGAIAVALVMVSYYAQLNRTLFAAPNLGQLGFTFSATARDWIGWFLGNIGLVIITLGFALIVMPYRTWSFYLRHLSTTGSIDADAMLQSSLASPRQGDGIADAFDLTPF